jgi:hypothetical protein
VTVVGNEVVGFEDRKQRCDWYDEEYEINIIILIMFNKV